MHAVVCEILRDICNDCIQCRLGILCPGCSDNVFSSQMVLDGLFGRNALRNLRIEGHPDLRQLNCNFSAAIDLLELRPRQLAYGHILQPDGDLHCLAGLVLQLYRIAIRVFGRINEVLIQVRCFNGFTISHDLAGIVIHRLRILNEVHLGRSEADGDDIAVFCAMSIAVAVIIGKLSKFNRLFICLDGSNIGIRETIGYNRPCGDHDFGIIDIEYIGILRDLLNLVGICLGHSSHSNRTTCTVISQLHGDGFIIIVLAVAVDVLEVLDGQICYFRGIRHHIDIVRNLCLIGTRPGFTIVKRRRKTENIVNHRDLCAFRQLCAFLQYDCSSVDIAQRLLDQRLPCSFIIRPVCKLESLRLNGHSHPRTAVVNSHIYAIGDFGITSTIFRAPYQTHQPSKAIPIRTCAKNRFMLLGIQFVCAQPFRIIIEGNLCSVCTVNAFRTILQE